MIMKNKIKKLFLWMLVAVVAISAAIIVYGYLTDWQWLRHTDIPSDEAILTVKILSVGDANAIVVESAGKVMVVDMGEENDASHLKQIIDSFDNRIVDVLVITHPHYDHYGGFKALVDHRITATYISPADSNASGYSYCLDYISARCDNIVKVNPGMTFELGNALVTVIGPLDKEYDNLNDSSVILKITAGSVDILFPGDATGTEMDDIMDSGIDIESDILLLAHHGSSADGANSYRLLREVFPSAVIISSAGEASDEGFPHERVLSRLRDLGCTIYRTDLDGDITITTNGTTYEITTEK